MNHWYLTAFMTLTVLCGCLVGAAASWSPVPLAQWTEAKSFDPVAGIQPPYGVWEEQGENLLARGTVDYWSTRLHPQEMGGAVRVATRFTVEASSGKPRQFPGGCIRWGFHWGENLPGWDFAVVLFWKDPLDFCRVQVSASRGEIALWDAASGFLQLIPCEVEVGKPHLLEIRTNGAHFQATLDGKPVMDYWNRSVTHSGGRVGLGVYNSTVRVERFEAGDMATFAAETMPPHRPDFHLRPAGGSLAMGPGGEEGLILFDGYEPISTFQQATGGNDGVLYQDAVRLKPGWRSAYYTWIGPGINYGVGGALLRLPEPPAKAFQVEKEGEELVFRFRTEASELAWAEHTCTVRYDPNREVYRYEYRTHTEFTVKEPYALHYFEITDPLTYNNRTPGPEVVNRWNPAGHQWWVFQGPEGDWQRSPLIDYLGKHNNQPTRWAGFQDFLYPDPVACPTFEVTPGWEQPPGRSFDLGLCHWGYDFHHTEEGASLVLPVGTKRDYTLVFTALPAAEAEKIFAQSVVAPKVATSKEQYPIFEPAGNTFATLSTREAPTSTMVWEGGSVDNTVGRTDKHSLRLDGPETAKVQVYQYAIEQWAEKWWVRGWFRSEDVGGRGLLVRVKYSYAREPEEIFYVGGLGKSDWTYFSFLTTVPQTRDCTNLEFELDGPGRVWLDDVALSAVVEGKEPTVTPSAIPAGLEPRTDLLIDLSPTEAPVNGVYDESRNGHALFLEGPTWVTEEGRGFLRFDGKDDFAYIPLKPVLEPRDAPPGTTGPEIYKPIFRLDEFTYEVWVRPHQPPDPQIGRMYVFDYRRNPQAYFDQFGAELGKCRFVYINSIFQGQEIRLEQTVPFDEWLHVVATHGNGKVILYLNGEKAGEVEYDPKAPGFGFFAYTWRYDVGSFLGTGNWLCGDLGPFRLYTRALSAEEAKEAYQRKW